MKKNLSFIFLCISFFFCAQQTLFNVGQYHSGCAQITNGVKIKTNIPFIPSYFPTVIIEGYAYGASNTLALQISWYVWGNKFYETSVVSSFGSHTPKIILGKENYNGGDYVVIFVEDQTYCLNFSVRSNYTTANTAWTIVDEPLLASTKMDLPYKNSFKGNVNFTNGIWSSDGNVGIGTSNPQNKLDVNGVIHAKEVKVDLNGWADFVFKKDYPLPTLEQVEKYISENGHLPNVPSEKEVIEKGLSLGENQKLLLQKIEELTLYSIEQNKLLKIQSEKIELLQKELNTLKSKK